MINRPEGLVYEVPDNYIVKYQNATGEIIETSVDAVDSYTAYKQVKKIPACKSIIYIGPRSAGDALDYEVHFDI